MITSAAWHYMGYDVVVPPLVPVLRISPDFEWITEAGRQEINGRLAALFGYREMGLFRDDEYVVDKAHRVIYTTRSGLDMMKREARKWAVEQEP